MDQILLYRGSDLIVDDDVTLSSLNTASLLVGGIDVKPLFVTKFTDLFNLNAGGSVTLTMVTTDAFNNMASQIDKSSTTAITVQPSGAGTYLVQLAICVNTSASSVRIQFFKNAGLITDGAITSADSSLYMSFVITLVAGDVLSINSLRQGANATIKSLLGGSSNLVISKLA